MRRIFLMFEFAILICCGFFIFSAFANADDNKIEIFKNEGNIEISNSTGWQINNCVQGAPTGNNFIALNSSSSQIISPTIDLSTAISSMLSFKARTYDGVKENSAEITISILNNNGWQIIASTTPTSTSMKEFNFDLSQYNSPIQIRFQTLSATSSKGAGIDDIKIYEIQTLNNFPIANAGEDQQVEVSEEIFFDGSNSTDTDGFIVNYFWDFGDGATSTGSTTTHSYLSAGNYLTQLTITDNNNATSSDTLIISVSELTTTTPTSTPYEAQPGDIVINEFYPSPNTDEKEWIELFNNSSLTIDLADWTVFDNSSVIAELDGLIEPKSFFVIEFNSGKLNNSGDKIILKNDDDIFDQISYGEIEDIKQSLSAPDKANALALTENGATSRGFKETITPTKGTSNIITSKAIKTSSASNYLNTVTTTLTLETQTETTTSTLTISTSTSRIIINEIFPRPSSNESDSEFIELKNIGTSTVNLNGWILTDKTGKKFKITSSSASVINPNDFFVVYRASSSIALNNSGIEIVNLYFPNGEIADSVEYLGPVAKDYSWSRNDAGDFFWTSSSTANFENYFTEIENEDEIADAKSTPKTIKSTKAKTPTTKIISSANTATFIPIERVKDSSVGQKIKTKGVITVLPGVLGTQIFYISGSILDKEGGALSNSGIQIYCNKKDFPELKLGDLIEVNGEISQSSGEKRIKITDRNNIKIISNNSQILPNTATSAEINSENLGSLIKIKGTIIQISGANIYLDDGIDEVKIYIKASTAMTAKDLNLKEGDAVEVVGIISATASGARILPRTIDDIKKVGEVKGEFEKSEIQNMQPPADNKYFWATIIFMAVIISLLLLKFFKKNKAT